MLFRFEGVSKFNSFDCLINLKKSAEVSMWPFVECVFWEATRSDDCPSLCQFPFIRNWIFSASNHVNPNSWMKSLKRKILTEKCFLSLRFNTIKFLPWIFTSYMLTPDYLVSRKVNGNRSSILREPSGSIVIGDRRSFTSSVFCRLLQMSFSCNFCFVVFVALVSFHESVALSFPSPFCFVITPNFLYLLRPSSRA